MVKLNHSNQKIELIKIMKLQFNNNLLKVIKKLWPKILFSINKKLITLRI